MAVKIGHASIDENKKIKGGAAGDQTGKEVCTRSWYDKGWDVCLRPINVDVAEKSAVVCEAICKNALVGYDQGQRTTLHSQLEKVDFDVSRLATKCECDCSSLMNVCAIAAGVSVDKSLRTATMVKPYAATGAYVKLTDIKYLRQDDYLRRGDILVAEGSHTVMVLTDGDRVTEDYADYTPKVYELGERILQKGDSGGDVVALQKSLLSLGYALGSFGVDKDGVDGDYGSFTAAAVVGLQQDNDINADGVYDAQTHNVLTQVLAKPKAPILTEAKAYTVTIPYIDATDMAFLTRIYPDAKIIIHIEGDKK